MYLRCTHKGRCPIYAIIDDNRIIANLFIRNKEIEKIYIKNNYLSFETLEKMYKIIKEAW